MKFLYLILLIFLGGCIRDDLGECTADVSITFSYRGDNGDESMFGKMIDQVALFVFSAVDGKLVTTRTVRKNMKLVLNPGNYKIVCWGNGGEFTGVSNYSTARVHHTGDHLYFGECDLTVPATGNVSVDIPFRGAHIGLNIYVKGLSGAPAVEVSNLMPEYDFSMNAAQPFTSTYNPVLIFDPSKNVHTAQIQAFRFEDDNPIVVSVRNPAGELKYTVSLREYMARNAISVSGINEATVSILIEFTAAGVCVTIPEWDRNTVTPQD